MLKMIHYFRSLLITLACVATPAIACSPPPNWRPPSVEELFEKATYVIYAKAIAIENSPDGKRARVDILETFKGPALKSIGAPGEGCGLTISIGETRVFFLDTSANGHVMAYPIGRSTEEILSTLRNLSGK